MGISIQANATIDLSNTSQLLGMGKNSGQGIFDKQIAKLQEQVKKIQEDSSLDPDSKKLKIQEIEDQIREIGKQKQAKQLEGQKNPPKKAKNNSSNDYATETASQDGVVYELTKAVVEGDSAVKNINKTNAMRLNITNELRIAEGKDNPSPSDETEQSRLQKALARTTESLYGQISETNGNVKESSKKIAKAKEAETENREVEKENTAASTEPGQEALTVAQGGGFTVSLQDAEKEKGLDELSGEQAAIEKTVNLGTAVKMKNNVYKKASPQPSPQVDITL